MTGVQTCALPIYYVRGAILRPQEVKQVAQHAGRGAPDVEALVGHGVEGTPSAWQFHRQALVIDAIHEEGQRPFAVVDGGEAAEAVVGVGDFTAVGQGFDQRLTKPGRCGSAASGRVQTCFRCGAGGRRDG